jgi:hypothetical protein
MFIMLKTFSGASRHNAGQKILKFKPPCNISTPSTLEQKKKKIILQTNYTIVITPGF